MTDKTAAFDAGVREMLEKLARIEHQALKSWLKGGKKVSDSMRKNLGISRGAMLRARLGLGADKAVAKAKTGLTGASERVRDAATKVKNINTKPSGLKSSGSSGNFAAAGDATNVGRPRPRARKPGTKFQGFSNYPESWGVKSNLPKPQALQAASG